ncbi:MAG: DUF5658 family protein [Methanomicrobiales archaeon]|nr:DUF5658 family protein [Methanomicrobiales archaeon]
MVFRAFAAKRQHPFQSSLGFVLMVLFGVCLALDICTTNQILSMGGAELNAVMVPVVGSPLVHGMLKSGFFVGALAWAAWCEDLIPDAGMTILSALSGWFLYVVIFNLYSLSFAPGLI